MKNFHKLLFCLLFLGGIFPFEGVGASQPQDQPAPKPLYRDPIYDGAADPVVIYNKGERRWFMYYTNRRANAEGLSGVAWVHGTPIGIAESTDGGATWSYRCDANISYGGADYTYWAPDVIIGDDELYHMFLTVVPGIFENWNYPRDIVHLTSRNGIDWDFVSVLPLATNKVIDASVIQDQNGLWWMFYNDEISGKTIFYATSPDLYTWEDHGQIVKERGEGPKVFRWQDCYFMIVDTWSGQAVLSSADLLNWSRQELKLLDLPGIGTDDGVVGNHADVVVNGGRAYIFYFTHPGRADSAENDNPRRSSIQVAELEYRNGRVVCDRNQPVYIHLKAK